MTEQAKITYRVFNRRTGSHVATCTTLKGARRAVDRRDNEYGAYVHYIIQTDENGVSRPRM